MNHHSPFQSLLTEANAIDAKVAAWRINLSMNPDKYDERLIELITQGIKQAAKCRVAYAQNSQSCSQP